MRVFVSDPLNREAVSLLASEGFEVLEQPDLDGASLGVALKGSSGLILRGKTKVTAEVLQHAGHLRVICRAGSGVDNIDLESAKEKQIAVFNTPGANSTSVAELTWGLILALHRKIALASESMKQGRWEKKSFSGHEVFGRRLGVIGLGQIGSQVARLGIAFGCKVVGHDANVDASLVSNQMESAPLDELLATSDIVTLHLPLNAETRGLLAGGMLATMKKGAVLVNAARGGLVDETELLGLLKNGHLAGAGLDVFEDEPPANQELISLSNVVATPHIGAATAEAQSRAGLRAATTVAEFLRDGEPPGRIV